jgi:hypothetical protein
MIKCPAFPTAPEGILEEKKLKEFRHLLTRLEVNQEQDGNSERERLLERNRVVYRFQDLKKEIILPTFRQLMLDLDRKGHLTRLWEKTPEVLRFDVQLQSRVPKRGAIEMSLHPTEARLRVEYGWTGGGREQELHSLDDVQPSFVADRMMHLLRHLL